jgi:hypothetical protein
VPIKIKLKKSSQSKIKTVIPLLIKEPENTPLLQSKIKILTYAKNNPASKT